MRVRRQESSEVRGHALRVHGNGGQAAVILVRAGDEESLTALTRVFREHRALTVDLDHTVPDSDRTVGDCVIRDDGVEVAMDGVGRFIMGVSMNLSWGKTSHAWRSTALEEGCVWVGLISEESYLKAFPGDALAPEDAKAQASGMPPLPLLRLKVAEAAG